MGLGTSPIKPPMSKRQREGQRQRSECRLGTGLWAWHRAGHAGGEHHVQGATRPQLSMWFQPRILIFIRKLWRSIKAILGTQGFEINRVPQKLPGDVQIKTGRGEGQAGWKQARPGVWRQRSRTRTSLRAERPQRRGAGTGQSGRETFSPRKLKKKKKSVRLNLWGNAIYPRVSDWALRQKQKQNKTKAG